MQTRLSLDIGTSSIGWILYAIIDDRPARILDGGVRIFGNGREAKTGQWLAVGRRNARAMCRRDRYLSRLAREYASAISVPVSATPLRQPQWTSPPAWASVVR